MQKEKTNFFHAHEQGVCNSGGQTAKTLTPFFAEEGHPSEEKLSAESAHPEEDLSEMAETYESNKGGDIADLLRNHPQQRKQK